MPHIARKSEKLDVVFSFDTTISMSQLLDEVRLRVKNMVSRLLADITGIRIAIFVHGDYYCRDTIYLTKHIDFSADVAEICSFVMAATGTEGGDCDECYELVLKEVREKLSWLPSSNKVLVMVGDALPHEPSYPQNTDNIDWRVETKRLGDMGVKIYGVQCRTDKPAAKFYKAISFNTGGTYLQLPQFSLLYDLIMGICYREHDEEMLEAYEKEVSKREEHTGTSSTPIFRVFSTLKGETTPPTPPSPGSTATDLSELLPRLKGMDESITSTEDTTSYQEDGNSDKETDSDADDLELETLREELKKLEAEKKRQEKILRKKDKKRLKKKIAQMKNEIAILKERNKDSDKEDDGPGAK